MDMLPMQMSVLTILIFQTLKIQESENPGASSIFSCSGHSWQTPMHHSFHGGSESLV